MSENLTPEVLEDLKAKAERVEKIGCRAAELTFDWLCSEFEDLPNKLAEDMSVKITDNIIWALGEGSTIDDFADAAQQVADLTARAEKAEQQVAAFRDAVVMTPGPEGRRSWGVNAAKLAAAWDLSPNKSEADSNGQ